MRNNEVSHWKTRYGMFALNELDYIYISLCQKPSIWISSRSFFTKFSAETALSRPPSYPPPLLENGSPARDLEDSSNPPTWLYPPAPRRYLGALRIVFFWLVVEPTPLKNIRQNGNLPKIGVKIKNIWNHHLVFVWRGKAEATFIPKTLCETPNGDRNVPYQKTWDPWTHWVAKVLPVPKGGEILRSLFWQCIGPGNFLEPGGSKNTIYMSHETNKKKHPDTFHTGSLIGIPISRLVK